MHGLGNDYLYMTELPADPAALSVKLSDRHFGIGSDGLILILPSEKADFMMRIFNADGSEAMMCGNGIRCVGKYVYDEGLTDKKLITVDTLSGIKTLTLFTGGDNKVHQVSVNMGQAVIGQDITLNISVDKDIRPVTGTDVSVGNPHFVTFVKDMTEIPPADIGPGIEKHPAFPGGVNAEFVQVISRGKLRMRVWERGSGITMACGTGACASAAAAVSKGFCDFNQPVEVVLDGGSLMITVSPDYSITMTGPAEKVFTCEI